MKFVSKLSRNDIITFYKSLYEEEDVIYLSKPFLNYNTHSIDAKFAIKCGWKKMIPFKMVKFRDFDIEEYSCGKVIENRASESHNKKWIDYLISKFGIEYIEAYNSCKICKS